MQNGKDKKDNEEPTTITITIRLIDSDSDMEEKQLKVLPRIHVSHLLKILSWSFNKSGFYNQDFDAFLIRHEMELPLDLNHRISDYGIKNDDIIEVRRKKLLISVKVNIHQNDVREYQVNASMPVYETVKLLGTLLNVKNTKELSLAIPGTSEKSVADIASIRWFDPTKSLNSQGVTSGDLVLLRKKYFIFNEDIGEAENNPVLRDLLLCQFQTQITQMKEATRKASQANSYGLLSDVDSSTSDQEGRSQDNSSFMSDVLKSLEKSASEANGAINSPKEEWMQTLSKHKEINSFFPVKSTTCSEANYLCVKSGGVCLTVAAHFSEEIVHKWSFEEITSWCKFDDGLKITVNGVSHTFFSDKLDQILEHLNHLSFLTEKEASGCKQTDIPLTRLSLSPAVSVPSILDDLSSVFSQSEVEEAGTGIQESTSSGAEASGIHNESSSHSHSPPMKKERTSNISPPTYFGLNHKELLETHMLLHIIVLDQEIRQIVVDVTQPVRGVIRDICATYGIQYPEGHYLRYPNSTEEILRQYGGRPRLDSLTGEFIDSSKPAKLNIMLEADKPLIEQLYFEIQPFVLLLRRVDFDDVDAAEKYSLEIGCEWPDGEDPGIARYRHFYQSWISVVQGNRDISKHTAIRLAGILTYLYHGSKNSAPSWPPLDFDPNCFLPQKFRSVVGIGKDIFKSHKKHGDADIKDSIEEVIQIVEDVPYSNGLHFNVKVPTKSEVLRLKKLEQRTLCISRDGIACLSSNGGKKEKCFRGKYSEIRNWATSDSSFSLVFSWAPAIIQDIKLMSFGDKSDDFYGYTYQSKQIMEMMQLYVKMAYNEVKKNPGKKLDSMSDV